MPVVIVVGAQWGDEGKGKVVDLLSERADMVVRYGGGANAGHTLVIGGEKLVTHLVPSGVLHEHVKCVLGDGMVIDPQTLLEEIDGCRARGLLGGGQLLVSSRAHVILPYHRWLESAREARAGAIGTTRRGIGPAYESKAARRGVRVADLGRPARLRELVEQNLDEIVPVLVSWGHERPGRAEIDALVADAERAGQALAPMVGDAGRAVDAAVRGGRNVLFEGAQGSLLDIDHGTYPFVTSSSTIAGGACTGAGVAPTRIDRVVGISKAYCTRVGSGPFPTEMASPQAEEWRQAGQEFGATTGRPRRCGWLDASALRLAVRVNGLNGLALTKLDVVRGRGRVRVCVGYRLGDVLLDEPPLDAEDLARVEPEYVEVDGWDEDSRSARTVEQLPAGARAYIATIERLVGAPMWLISVGPDRDETILLRDPFAPLA
ncbi:MAG TPA: adenylosuccinate synthase [Kofleriaceae bacterium]|nr:adenylosuccinate synthase [Kofleriaceae bacterium]